MLRLPAIVLTAPSRPAAERDLGIEDLAQVLALGEAILDRAEGARGGARAADDLVLRSGRVHAHPGEQGVAAGVDRDRRLLGGRRFERRGPRELLDRAEAAGRRRADPGLDLIERVL